MKFIADMGISPRVVDDLRPKGHDAVHLAEQGLNRMADGDILQKALQENRVLLTHDRDFGELLAASGENCQALSSFGSRICVPQTSFSIFIAFCVKMPKP